MWLHPHRSWLALAFVSHPFQPQLKGVGWIWLLHLDLCQGTRKRYAMMRHKNSRDGAMIAWPSDSIKHETCSPTKLTGKI